MNVPGMQCFCRIGMGLHGYMLWRGRLSCVILALWSGLYWDRATSKARTIKTPPDPSQISHSPCKTPFSKNLQSQDRSSTDRQDSPMQLHGQGGTAG